MSAAGPQPGLGAVARLFTRLGLTAFGGPAAHVALMHDEVVRRRRWLDERTFLDRFGLTNLIPGPNSTELAMLVGSELAGGKGLLVAGACFIVPAAAIVLALAWAYVEHGTTPAAEGLLYGIKPVVLAVVAQALVSLGRKALAGIGVLLVGAGAFALYLAGYNELLLLFGLGLAYMVAANLRRSGAALAALPLSLAGPGLPAALTERAESVELARLFGIFLKVGAVLYGSGYVLLAFLRGDLVVRTGWLTDVQLLDAISIGQVTPGPLFTTATFVGYVVAGLPGALVATAGIFLPSLVFVAAVRPVADRLRRSPWTAAFLDGVNAAALGLMAGVLAELARDALVDPLTVALALAAGAALLFSQINATALIATGGLAGLAAELLR